MEETQKDKDARIRQTFYGNGAYPGSNNLLNNGMSEAAATNTSGFYRPAGYATGTRFRPSTQESSNGIKRSSLAGEGLSDGNILSNID